MNTIRYIKIRGARQHNLQNVSIDIPRDQMVVITGLSGSGKSTLAFDTIHAEGRRKYIETLSAYARQFLEQMQKPDVEHIEGLPPTIAIEQRSGASSPRSTVATTTEVYDYLRLLFARVGEPHCWICQRPIHRQDPTQIVDEAMTWPEDTRLLVLAPLVRGQRGEHRDVLKQIQREGFVRIRLNGKILDLRDVPKLAKNRKHSIDVVVDRLAVKPDIRSRLAESIALALRMGNDAVCVCREKARDRWEDHVFSVRFACPLHPEAALPELTPRLFSFNAPQGACVTCAGLGNVQEFDPDLVVSDPTLSLSAGAVDAWRHSGKRLNALYRQLLEDFCQQFQVPPDLPFQKLPADARRILLHGTTAEDEQRYGARFEGVVPNLKRRWETTESESVKQRLHAYLSERPCDSCHGARLQPAPLAVRIAGKNIHDVTTLSIDAAHEFFSKLSETKAEAVCGTGVSPVQRRRDAGATQEKSPQSFLEGERATIAEPIVREIVRRLRFMRDVGVGYLTLDRARATLSGGEAQRIRLATQVGSGLVGVCYVLDEPTIGLHPRDSHQLIATLRQLVEAGNTVLVVEHDEETIRTADHLIDMGPGAGTNGGRVVAAGPLAEVLRSADSLTARYLRGDVSVPVPTKRRKIVLPSQSIEIRGAAEHNLKSIDVTIPLGSIVCVTGVSGSGKSTLVNEVLLKALRKHLYQAKIKPGKHEAILGISRVDKVVEIDQSPIGRTPRSNPATYTGAFDLIRQLFARTREAKIRGYDASRFSFNVRGGRCEACLGQGIKRIEMHFLPDVYVQCEVCKGTRYNRETLEVRYRGKTIADVLDMPVGPSSSFFDSIANLKQIMLALDEVGLSYMKLGQASTTLSGGEAQRIKLAAELARTPSDHTLYVLDEPTTGLHFADVHNLLRVLDRLADKGHTVLIIEHNLEVIKTADWIIDLGPEGGDQGGQVITTGRPEEIAQNPNSHTGRYLRSRLGLPT